MFVGADVEPMIPMTINSAEAPVWIEFGPPLDNPDFSFNSISVESQASTPGLALTVEEFNFSTGAYEVVGEESECLIDTMSWNRF